MTNISKLCLLVGIVALPCWAFQSVNNAVHQARDGVACYASRRDILSLLVPVGLASTGLITPMDPAFADDADLTEQMFNADGSLKEGYESEVKYRDVKFTWDQSDSLAINQDGINVQDTKAGSQYALSYRYPMRWSDGKDGDPIYFDRNQGINKKATKRITLFQAKGTATDDRLEKATTIGVAKALDVPEELSRLFKSDIISGRTVEKGDQKYFEFDMASAPETCGSSNENLGLGFCPYGECICVSNPVKWYDKPKFFFPRNSQCRISNDTIQDNIFLLSATVVNSRLYCMVVEVDDTKVWKLESKELKRLRSSFLIEEATA